MYKKFIELFADKITDLAGPFLKKDIDYILIAPISRSAKNGLGIGIKFGGVESNLGTTNCSPFHISGERFSGLYDILFGIPNAFPHGEQLVQFPGKVFVRIVPVAIGTVQIIEHGTGTPYFTDHGLKVADSVALKAIDIFV